MERLERYRGHLYNWYDTRTLKPLRPHYVSSVDSGNLAGALFTLRAGLWELKKQPIVSPRVLTGLRDTLEMLSSPATDRLREKLQAPPPPTVPAMLALLQELSRDVAALPANGDAEQQWWTQALVRQCHAARDDLQFLVPDPQQFDHVPTLQELAGASTGGDRAAERIRQIDQLAQRCTELAVMDFAFLYDPARDLLAIGYNVTDRRCDPSYYDLLASEARLASFILIAQDQLPQDHWFALGRQLTTHAGAMALLSWSGSMFEYLMPLLVMPTYEHTLLDQTYRAVVARQIEYGRAARRAVGYFRVVLQHHRRPRRLSVWRVRRAGFGLQARSRRRSGRRAVRVGAGVDGRAPGGVPESGNAGARTVTTARTDCMKRSISHPRACPAARPAFRSAVSWRITRG